MHLYPTHANSSLKIIRHHHQLEGYFNFKTQLSIVTFNEKHLFYPNLLSRRCILYVISPLVLEHLYAFCTLDNLSFHLAQIFPTPYKLMLVLSLDPRALSRRWVQNEGMLFLLDLTKRRSQTYQIPICNMQFSLFSGVWHMAPCRLKYDDLILVG